MAVKVINYLGDEGLSSGPITRRRVDGFWTDSSASILCLSLAQILFQFFVLNLSVRSEFYFSMTTLAVSQPIADDRDHPSKPAAYGAFRDKVFHSCDETVRLACTIRKYRWPLRMRMSGSRYASRTHFALRLLLSRSKGYL